MRHGACRAAGCPRSSARAVTHGDEGTRWARGPRALPSPVNGGAPASCGERAYFGYQRRCVTALSFLAAPPQTSTTRSGIDDQTDMPDNRVAPSSPPKGKGARRHEAFEPLRQGHESKPLPPVSGVPVRSAVPGSVARTRRHSSTAAADCAHFHREEVPAGRADRVSTADIWEQAAPATVGFKRVPLETFHNDITDPNREQNLVSLLMTEIAAHQTDASRFLRSADKTKDRQGKRSRCSLWIITIFIYLVQIGAASKLLGNGRSGYDTTALVVTFTEGLGNIYNLTAFDSAVTAAGDAGQPGLFSVFDSLMPVERQFSEATIQSIMMTESSNLQKEQLMRRCHVSLVDTQNSAAATCPYKLNVCNTYKGVLNKIINMFAGGFVICGIVFHELFGMLTMEYPVVMPVPDRDGTQPPRLKHIWVLYMFLAAHLCLVITCVTACMGAHVPSFLLPKPTSFS